jgi:hypothetical protein
MERGEKTFPGGCLRVSMQIVKLSPFLEKSLAYRMTVLLEYAGIVHSSSFQTT